MLVYGVKSKSKTDDVSLGRPSVCLSESRRVGWEVDGAIVLRFARSREKGLLALVADDAHRSSVLLGKAIVRSSSSAFASIVVGVPRGTYGLQLRDSLRTSLLVVPGALLRSLGSLSGGISKLSEGGPSIGDHGISVGGESGRSRHRRRQGGLTLPPPILEGFLG